MLGRLFSPKISSRLQPATDNANCRFAAWKSQKRTRIEPHKQESVDIDLRTLLCCPRMNWMRTLFVFVCLQATFFGQVDKQSPCFAYLQDGDVYAKCSGEVIRLTPTRDVSDFAIADDGSVLALERERVIGLTKDGSGAIADCDVRLYRLSSNTTPRTIPHACGGLYASCGTLVIEDRTKGVDDLLTGTKIQIEGFKSFSCSANKTVVAGWRGSCCHDFVVQAPQTSYAEPVAGGASVSAAGTVAYFTEGSNDNSLCVIDGGGKRSCLKHADAFGKLSVSDSGDVLFTTHTEGGCRYRKGSITKVRPPDSGDDQCLGISVWNPSSGSKFLVKELAQRPQWLTPEAWSAINNCAKSGSCLPLK
jgi:hypothetical protein